MNSLGFLIGEAFVNLRRHSFMTFAAITTIAVSLGLLGAFLITFYEVDTATHHAVSAFEMRIFCKPAVTKQALGDLQDQIRALPGVGSVMFRSRDEIWKEQTRDYPIDVSGIPNQMPDTFVVHMTDPARVAGDAATIRSWKDSVQDVAVPETEMNGVNRIASFLRSVGLVSGIVLLVGALIVVSNTIRISVFARRREIRIMQIVGATTWFIRLPLLLEGLIHGIGGGLLACAGLYFVGRYVEALIRQTVPMLLPYGGPVDILRFGLIVVGAGAAIGASGSLLSIRRYLRTV
jgi:cell division transport system permease protein